MHLHALSAPQPRTPRTCRAPPNGSRARDTRRPAARNTTDAEHRCAHRAASRSGCAKRPRTRTTAAALARSRGGTACRRRGALRPRAARSGRRGRGAGCRVSHRRNHGSSSSLKEAGAPAQRLITPFEPEELAKTCEVAQASIELFPQSWRITTLPLKIIITSSSEVSCPKLSYYFCRSSSCRTATQIQQT